MIRIVLAVGVGWLSTALAYGETGGDAAKNQAAIDAKLKSLQERVVAPQSKHVTFQQEVYKAFRKRTIRSKGYAMFGAPNKFRWVLETPVNEELIYNGKKFYQFRPSENVAVEFPDTSGEGRNIDQLVNMVLDLGKLLEKYKATRYQEASGQIQLTLEPNSKNDEISSVNLTVGAKDGSVNRVVLNYTTGDKTTIEFTDTAKKVDPKVFDWVAPKGVKVTRPAAVNQ